MQPKSIITIQYIYWQKNNLKKPQWQVLTNAFLENIVLNKPYIIILFHPDRLIEDAHKQSQIMLILNTRLSIKMYSKVIYRLNREAKRGICSSILLEGLLNSYSLFHIWITNHLTPILKIFPKKKYVSGQVLIIPESKISWVYFLDQDIFYHWNSPKYRV